MIEAWHLWIVAGVAFWIIEMFTPGFVVGIFGMSCITVAPFSWMGFSLTIQLVVFGVATAILSLFVRPIILKHFCRTGARAATNVDALIGERCRVVEEIDNASGTGRVMIGGEYWRSVTPDDSRVAVGKIVTVREVTGCKVVVGVASSEEGALP
jgi:membrane protein implicated in regulation of membrane protease activity